MSPLLGWAGCALWALGQAPVADVAALADTSWRAREHALAALAAAPGRAEAWRQARYTHPDPEVRRRCECLLAELRRRLAGLDEWPELAVTWSDRYDVTPASVQHHRAAVAALAHGPDLRSSPAILAAERRLRRLATEHLACHLLGAGWPEADVGGVLRLLAAEERTRAGAGIRPVPVP